MLPTGAGFIAILIRKSSLSLVVIALSRCRDCISFLATSNHSGSILRTDDGKLCILGK